MWFCFNRRTKESKRRNQAIPEQQWLVNGNCFLDPSWQFYSFIWTLLTSPCSTCTSHTSHWRCLGSADKHFPSVLLLYHKALACLECFGGFLGQGLLGGWEGSPSLLEKSQDRSSEILQRNISLLLGKISRKHWALPGYLIVLPGSERRPCDQDIFNKIAKIFTKTEHKQQSIIGQRWKGMRCYALKLLLLLSVICWYLLACIRFAIFVINPQCLSFDVIPVFLT